MGRTKKEFLDFLEAQAKEIIRHRKRACKKAGKDLGQAPVFEWIRLHSHSFREEWRARRSQAS